MRILQVISHYVPAYGFGGPLRVAHSLGKALSKQGHEVRVCCTNMETPEADLNVKVSAPVQVDQVTVFYEPVSGSRYLGFSMRLFSRVRQQMAWADVVLVHFHYQFANWAGAWLARKHGKPYVLFAHGCLQRSGIKHKRSLLKQLVLATVEKENFSKALFVAFTCRDEQDVSFFSERGHVIPNGFDDSSYQDHVPVGLFRSKFPKLIGKDFFLFLGRLDIAHKGLDLLIEAFAQVACEIPNLNLVLAGPDERGERAKLDGMIRAVGLTDRIIFTGLVDGELKQAALNEADAFVLPSRFEGASIAMLEALHAGLPVLITDQIGMHPEIASEGCGIVVPVESGQLAEGLRKLSLAHIRAGFENRGRNLVRRKYLWDAIAAGLIGQLERRIA